MRDHVGVHLPSKTMRISALTEKDKGDLTFGLSSGVDYIAMSFVRRAEDLQQIREICTAWGAPTPVIAKIETLDAVENLESIVAASDGVMVARGDLGVEFPPERVPVIQRQILARGAARAAPGHRRDRDAPVDDQVDAPDARRGERRGQRGLLGHRLPDALAARRRPGDHPTLACSMMARIAMEAEASPFFEQAPYVSRATSVAEAIARGACNTAREIGAKYLVAFTESGSSAMTVSLARPQRPHHRLLAEREDAAADGPLLGRRPARDACDARHRRARGLVHGRLLAGGFGSPGERIVIVFGAPIGVSGSTNTIRVHVLG